MTSDLTAWRRCGCCRAWWRRPRPEAAPRRRGRPCWGPRALRCRPLRSRRKWQTLAADWIGGRGSGRPSRSSGTATAWFKDKTPLVSRRGPAGLSNTPHSWWAGGVLHVRKVWRPAEGVHRQRALALLLLRLPLLLQMPPGQIQAAVNLTGILPVRNSSPAYTLREGAVRLPDGDQPWRICGSRRRTAAGPR